MNVNDVLIEPVLTEKSTFLREDNYFIFKVRKDANKIQIKKAVESIYDVKVEDCKIINVKPKRKMLRTRRGYGKTVSVKKAMVKLQKGQTIAELEV